MNIYQIYEGWRNRIYPPKELKDIIESLKVERISKCDNCIYHSKNHNTPLRPDNHCVHCGCNIEAKTACLSCECPIGIWKAFTKNSEEEEQIKKYLDDSKEN
jgi:DNA-directed RNA polymerase subunit N (RpoN/RPB10)